MIAGGAEVRFTADDGVDLFVRHFRAHTALAERNLVIIHGASEHGGRYGHVARAAAARGWNVLTPDLRGHGQSGGVPVHVNKFGRYLDDLDQLWGHFQLDPLRTALLAHSMGGLVAIRYVQTRPPRVQALVLSSPLLGLLVKVPLLTRVLGRVLYFVAPRTRFQSLVDPADTTRDPELLEQRLADPLIHRSLTASWFFEMQSALRKAHRAAKDLTLPLLVMQAGVERVVDPLASQQWTEAVSSSDKTFQLFPEHLHEVLNEPDRQETIAGMLDWLETRIPAPQARASG